MPGLIGCVSDHPLEAGLIEAMVQPMRHRPTYQVKTEKKGPLAIGTVDLASGSQSDMAESSDGRYFLAVFGMIYEPWAHRGAGLAAGLLVRWQKEGSKALADLNGEYLVCLWDRTDERLTLINDRLGLKRLHLWHNRTTFAFSSELKSLAVLPEVRRDIDEEALAELLTFGHLQDDRTLLKEVRLLPPASVLTWQHGKFSITQYWQYAFCADARLENPARAADEYAHHVQTAVERRIRGGERIGLLLSGGLDSRTLAGMIHRLRPDGPLFTLTTGHAHAHDVRFAKQIARAVRSQHATIDIPDTFFQDFASRYVWVLDGSVTAHGCHRSYAIPQPPDQVDALFNGFLGDVLSGGKPLDNVIGLSSSKEKLIQAGYEHYAIVFDEALLARVLRPEIYAHIRGFSYDAFANSVRRAHVEHPADGVVFAELIQRERVGNPRVQVDFLSAECLMATPFTDKEFIDFALRLPVHQRLERRAYTRMICHQFPDLARVPRSGGGLPIAHSRIRASLHWRWLLFARHTLPKLTGGRFGGHPYGTFVHCAQAFHGAGRRFIKETLINNPLLEEHFQMDALKQMVEEFLERGTTDAQMECLAALVSFALFRRQISSLATYSGTGIFKKTAEALSCR